MWLWLVLLDQCCAKLLHKKVGMIDTRGKEQRRAALRRRAFPCDGFGKGAMERAGVDFFVELGDLEIDLILKVEQVDLTCARIDNIDVFALLEADACLAQRRRNTARRSVIDQITINDRLPVAITKDRWSKNFAGVQCRGRGQRYPRGVEIVEYTTVGRQVIFEVAKPEIVFAQLGVQWIAARRFVDDDEIIGAGRRTCCIRVFEDASDHCLDSCHLYPVGRFRELAGEVRDRKHLIELQESSGVRGAHGVKGLAAKRIPFDTEQDSPEQ